MDVKSVAAAEEILFGEDFSLSLAFVNIFWNPLAPMVVCSAERQKKTRVHHYIETVVPEYDDITFRRMFRLQRSSVEAILVEIGARLTYEEPIRGRPPLSPEKQLLITLWYLGTQSTVLVTADRFGVTDFSVIRARRNVVDALVSLRPRVIRWPNRDEINSTILGFQDLKGFPDVIGALDGTHIHITPPRNHPEQYVNRKGFHSLQLQCVCNSNLLFIHSYVGWPGSVHDARVVKNSDLWDNGPQLCEGKHLIADSAYPLQEWLLTPYRRVGILTREQTNYNIALSSTRVVIERAFGLLKGRFKRLHHINVAGLAHTCEIIMACCVLHNLCILQGDVLPEYFDNEDQQEVVVNAIGNVAGVVKRNRIAHLLLHPENN